MKFGKESRAQMVPEWQEAYMDYDHLKTLLKAIQTFKQTKGPFPSPATRKSLYRTYSGLTQRSNSPLSTPTSDIESQSIVVKSVPRDGQDCYETTFLFASEGSGEYEIAYFRKLDEEFSKVVNFYRSKVEEVMIEAAMLNKQMDALIAFRIKVDNPQFDGQVELNCLASDVSASTAALSASTPSSAKPSRRFPLDVIDEGSSGKGQLGQSNDDKEVEKDMNAVNENVGVTKPIMSIKGSRPATLEILDHVHMNDMMETPISTIKGCLNILPDKTELRFSKENLNKIEQLLKKAFFEFYHKLRLLKSYSFLNVLAFYKIMKKYDKIASRRASKPYVKMVDNSYLGSSDEVIKLMERVEATFIKHFSNSNRSKGMNTLRPKAKRERHRITFSLGSTIALILALALIIRANNIIDHEHRPRYLDAMLPLYSLFGFIVLHMLLYAATVYFWRHYRVNYPYIYGFKEGTGLGYREILLPAFSLATLALGTVLANLDMNMDPITKDNKKFTRLLPLGLALVVLPDFFLADQLTSQVEALRSLEFYLCYYAWRNYEEGKNNCNTDVFNTFYFLVAAVPYWLRLLQCLRRLYEEKDFMQGLNGLKYFSTIVAIATRTAFSLNRGIGWRIIAGIASAIAMIFGTYWDLVIDWGLLQRNSKNRWLRDKLLVPHNSIYFGAMVMNVLLRFAWLQTVLRPTPRLENEHLNNVGKYRAFKSAPLPFNYHEDKNRDEPFEAAYISSSYLTHPVTLHHHLLTTAATDSGDLPRIRYAY
ncbi:hypothetical protein LguiB_024951 [Lonicera macranthoides]